MKRLRLFRGIALIEGVTTLALFLVAMPLKYWADFPALVPPVGMIHGVAWVAYVAAMVICLPGNGFSMFEAVRTFIAGLFPFGTFLNDPLIRRKLHRRIEPQVFA
jgi:integral membrane protein